MGNDENRHYISNRRKLSGVLFETALPNEYLVQVGRKVVKPVLGGRRFRLFKKFLRVPGTVETLYFQTDNANMNYQGIGVEGYASWRVDPEHPEVAISTLDFFDENNPMRDTNGKLTTICVEAVRHVIANMSIDDALKKKDEIGNNLKEQLKKFEERWGIVFDQVGIEKVTIMSEKLFEDLQSEFRDRLRLDISRTRIQTDRQIAAEENTTREATETEQIETDRKVRLARAEGESSVNSDRLTKVQLLAEQKRLIDEDRFRKGAQFRLEQQEKEFSQKSEEQRLKAELQQLEQAVLQGDADLEDIRKQIERKNLEIFREKKDIQQTYSEEQLSSELIHTLPEIYKSLQIDNYSIMSGDGSISPVSRILQEVLGVLKINGMEDVLHRATGAGNPGDGK